MKRQNRGFESLWASMLALCLLVGTPGSGRADETRPSGEDEAAQSPGAPVGEAPVEQTRRAPAVGIEEITVTARKREENLQDTPIAISAFSTDDLKDLDVRRIQDITNSVPNLSFDSAAGTGNSARINLRAVGNGDPISSDDPGVGLYLDGVYLARAQGSLLTVSDIERVEVLRGPQGTLFGKNTIGGAVNIITRKPSFDAFEGSAEVRLGNYDRFDSRVSMNIPIVPELAAARISFATGTRDGFVRNQTTGDRYADDKLLATRGQFLLVPAENMEALFSVDHSIERRKPQGGSCEITNSRFPGTAGAPAAAIFASFAGTPLVTQAANFDAGFGTFLFGGPEASNGSATSPLVATNSFLNACSQDLSRDEDKVASDLSFQRDHLKTFGAAGTFTWELLENVSFKSISAWRRQEPEQRRDLDYTAVALAQSSADAGKESQDQISQELQLTGNALDSKLSWVMGAYFFHEKNQDRIFQGIATTTPLFFPIARARTMEGVLLTDVFGGPDGALAALQGQGFVTSNQIRDASPAELQAIFDRLGGAAVVGGTPDQLQAAAASLAASPLGANFISSGARTATRLKVNNTSYAGYAQLSYDVNDALSVTTGLRRTVEKRRIQNLIRYDTTGLAGAVPGLAGDRNFFFDSTERFGDWSPMANVSFKASEDSLFYANWSRGFKSGGFNGRAMSNTDDRSTQKIDDEKLTAYEVGFKSKWFENRLIFNVAGFYNIYEDIQLTIVGADATTNQIQVFVVNAGEAEIKGAEVELRALPFAGLELTSSVGITNARYTEFDSIDPTSTEDQKDNQLPNAPTYTMNFGAGYMLPIGSLGDLRLRTDWTHIGRSGTDVADSRILRKGKHGELDATLTWLVADGLTEVALFGNNLLNREYFTNGINFADSFGHATRFYSAPRTYGIELRRRF